MTTRAKVLFVGINSILTGQRESHGSARFEYLACTQRSQFDQQLRTFNEALVSGTLWTYADHHVADALSFLDYTLLEKILERHLFCPMSPEQRRVTLIGAVSYWHKFMQRQNFQLIVYGTYAPHWVWNFSLALAAKLLDIQQFTVCGDVLSYRINLMRLGSNEVLPLSTVKRESAPIREFCIQQKGSTTHPPYIRSFAGGAAKIFMVGAARNSAKQAVKNYRAIQAGTSHLQFADYAASPAKQCLRKFWSDMRASAASNHLRKRYLSLQEDLRADPSRLQALLRGARTAVYFANLQPEVTTTPDAGHFNNPKLIMAELLRRGFSVFYKEHPNSFLSSIGSLANQSSIYKDPSFYDDLRAVGVRLLPTDAANNDIVESGALIVTATGLIALQAACKGARVLMPGRAWYGNPPGVLTTFDQLDSDLPRSGVEEILAYLEERWGYAIPNVVGTMTGKVDGSQPDVETFFDAVARFAGRCLAGNDAWPKRLSAGSVPRASAELSAVQ